MNKLKEVRKILIFILALNWLVAFSKIVYGLITGCASMTADGVHSFGDGASNIIGLVGVWVASKPKDESHPYGHKKFETIATLGIAAVLFIAAFNILKDAFIRISEPVMPDVTIFSFALMVVTMAINIFVMKYEALKGKRLSSDILICDALHTKSDIFASLAVVGTLVSIKMGFTFLDIIVASFIAVLIGKSGIDILKNGFNVLCDRNVISKSKIENVVAGISGVRSIHHIRTHGRIDDIHADFHLVIDARMHVDDVHNLSHEIETILKEKISGITEVNIHIEPSGNKAKRQ